MGTAQQWFNVALVGGIWAGGMLLFDLVWPRRAGQYSFAHILAAILAGLSFGLLTTFGWNAVRAPLIYLVMPALLATVFAGVFYRRTIRNQGIPSSTPD